MFWMAVEMVMMIYHWFIHPWIFWCAIFRICLVLICLEFITRSTEITFPSLLLTNIAPLLWKTFEGLSEINVRLESIIFEEFPLPREITYHLQIIYRDRYGELYTQRMKQEKQKNITHIHFLIPGDTNVTTLNQVSPYMYVALLGIKQYPSGNMYLFTKLLPLSLVFKIYPFYRDITGPFTPAALTTQRTVIENLNSLRFLSWRGLILLLIKFRSLSLQGKEVSSKSNWK